MNETKYDVSVLREIKVMFDNDLVRKVNMEIDEFMEILGDNSNKREVFQYVMKKSDEYKSTTRKIADAFKLINSYSYALSVIFEDYDILLYNNIERYLMNLDNPDIELSINVKVNDEIYKLSKSFNISELDENPNYIFIDIIRSINQKIKESANEQEHTGIKMVQS